MTGNFLNFHTVCRKKKITYFVRLLTGASELKPFPFIVLFVSGAEPDPPLRPSPSKSADPLEVLLFALASEILAIPPEPDLLCSPPSELALISGLSGTLPVK